jgi:hypothetical protein
MRGYTVFRIHLMRPGTTAVTVAFGGTVADEASVRQRATNEGLLAGSTTDIQPGPNMWGYIDYIKRHYNGGA